MGDPPTGKPPLVGDTGISWGKNQKEGTALFFKRIFRDYFTSLG
jgi:hypothetical protein